MVPLGHTLNLLRRAKSKSVSNFVTDICPAKAKRTVSWFIYFGTASAGIFVFILLIFILTWILFMVWIGLLQFRWPYSAHSKKLGPSLILINLVLCLKNLLPALPIRSPPSGLEKSRIRKHLLVFSLAAPVAAVVTYVGIVQGGSPSLSSLSTTGEMSRWLMRHAAG